MTNGADILFVTWDGGGNVPPALGIARELQTRGHHVRFLGHQTQREALTRAGVEVETPRHTRLFDSRTDNTPRRLLATFGDRGQGRDLLEAVARRPADLVVIDGLTFGAMRAAADSGLRYAVLEHTYDAEFRSGVLAGPMGLYLRLRRFQPKQTFDGAAARLVATVPSLDPLPTAPANLRRIGPVVEVAERRPAARPMILVSLSTFAFNRMGQCLQSIVDATAGLGADVVVTTGPALDPADLRVPSGVEVHRFVPHVELMPRASLVVGHGGHGTTMQALAHDLPLLVMPMDGFTDQRRIARSLEAAGVGRRVRKGASPEAIAPVLAELLADGPHRAAAARLGAEVRSLPGAVLGADAVEDLIRDAAAAPGRPAPRP